MTGKKEGVITGYYKHREKPADTTSFPVGQILALAINSDGKILVSHCIRVYHSLYFLRSAVDKITWFVFGMQRHYHI